MPRREEEKRTKKKITKGRGKTVAPAEPKKAVPTRASKGKPIAKRRPRERHLTPKEEQEILTRFSKGEALAQVAKSYEKSLSEEIANLKRAFDAEEFLFKDGVWQLAS